MSKSRDREPTFAHTLHVEREAGSVTARAGDLLVVKSFTDDVRRAMINTLPDAVAWLDAMDALEREATEELRALWKKSRATR